MERGALRERDRNRGNTWGLNMGYGEMGGEGT